MDNRKMHLTTLLLLIFLVTCINCNFLVMPQAKVSECANKAVTLTWTIESFTSAGFVSWIYNSTTLIMRQSGPTNRPVPQGSYVGRVENGSNSDLIIKSPLTSDTGGYQCSVTYNNGTEVLSDVVSLYIYDNWAVTLKITKEQKGQSATLTSNVYDPSVQQTWSTGAQGSSITVTEDGVYSLCISGGRAECLDPSSTNCTSYSLKIEGSTTVSTINLSTDDSTITASETSTKNIMQSISTTQSSVSLSDTSTIEGNTFSGNTESVNTKSETSTASVTTSPSGFSEEMIIIISTVSAVGVILLIVIIGIVVLCCKQRTGTTDKMKIKNKHGRLQATNRKNKDLNSNYNQAQKNKYESKSKMGDSTSTKLNKKHPQYDIWYGDRMPTGVEFSRSQKYHQQNSFPRNQNHYRNQNSAYCLPYTDPGNMMYYQSEYNEDMLGYSRAGPYRMQQFYPEPHARQYRHTDDGLERRIGHRRGDYGSYWDNDTLY